MNSNPQEQQYPVPRIRIEQNRLVFIDEKTTASANPVWDALWQTVCPGYISVACAPDLTRVDELKTQSWRGGQGVGRREVTGFWGLRIWALRCARDRGNCAKNDRKRTIFWVYSPKKTEKVAR